MSKIPNNTVSTGYRLYFLGLGSGQPQYPIGCLLWSGFEEFPERPWVECPGFPLTTPSFQNNANVVIDRAKNTGSRLSATRWLIPVFPSKSHN